MSQMRIFVSHSHQDNAFCHALVKALRGAGADVWYDEHDLGSGRLSPTIEREVRERPVFVVILSPVALRSPWVEDETRWAYGLFRKDASRLILPVTAASIAENDIWLFLQDFRRIEAAGLQPFPRGEAVRRTLRTLVLTPTGEKPAPTAPLPKDSAEELVARGKALEAQRRQSEALPLFERATQLAPQSFVAWANLGVTLNLLEKWQKALLAHERATTLDPNDALAWNNKGVALGSLKRVEEALAAFERATTLDPNNAMGWGNKGRTLRDLARYPEALDAFDRALAIDPTDSRAWSDRGRALSSLEHSEEAVTAFDRAATYDPNNSRAWSNKGLALTSLKRYEEALTAYERATTLDPKYGLAWNNKGNLLLRLGRYEEAVIAYDRALTLRESPGRWRTKAVVLRILGRIIEADAAEQRAKELGG
jgi:tetratricopeptide (TPR) repeat protein